MQCFLHGRVDCAPRSVLLCIAFLLAASLQQRADGQCTAPPLSIVERLVEGGPAGGAAESGAFSAVGIHGDGRFLITFQSRPYPPNSLNNMIARRYCADGTDLGTWAPLSVQPPAAQYPSEHFDASTDISLCGDVRVAWWAERSPGHAFAPQILWHDFLFDPFTPTPQGVLIAGYNDWRPSASIACTNATFVWPRDISTVTPSGLLWTFNTYPPPFQVVRSCDNQTALCFAQGINEWAPCMAMRDSDGRFVVAWADPELPLNFESDTNIKMQVYEANGTPIGGEVLVNDPALETNPSSQVSPALDFDDLGNIIVVWASAQPFRCAGEVHVYVRRFLFTNPNAPVALGPQLIVDSDSLSAWQPSRELSGEITARPTVSLTNSTNALLRGRFFVAWNVVDVLNNTIREVHGQYFDVLGDARGGAFRVNQATGGAENVRTLGFSSQHTGRYGPDDQVVVTYTAGVQSPQAYFTILPPGYQGPLSCDYCASCPALCTDCPKGDINRDCDIDGEDIQPFTDLLLGGPIVSKCYNVVQSCAADINSDGAVTTADHALFICLLLSDPADYCDCIGGGPGPSMAAGGGGPQMASQGAQQALLDNWDILHPRDAYPELTDQQFASIRGRYMADIGLLDPTWMDAWDAYQLWKQVNPRESRADLTDKGYARLCVEMMQQFGAL